MFKLVCYLKDELINLKLRKLRRNSYSPHILNINKRFIINKILKNRPKSSINEQLCNQYHNNSVSHQ